MAASFVARRSTHEAPLVASSSEDDADILTRARVLASSPQKAGPPIKRGATALQAISVPDAHLEESSDSDAELLRRSKQAVRQQVHRSHKLESCMVSTLLAFGFSKKN